MSDDGNGMKIVRLRSENVKRIRAVEITPTGDLVVISGRNGQGKSSVLDSIAYTLGGKSLLPPRPIRDGAESAMAEVDLGTLKVTRRWTANDRSYLEVTASDGRNLRSPQAVLDEMCGQFTFDPLAFLRLKPAEQRDSLLNLLGITEKVDRLDQDRQAKYDTRTRVNRELKQAEAAAAEAPEPPPGTPSEPVSMGDLTELLRNAQVVSRENSGQREKMARLQGQLEHVRAGINLWFGRIEDLKRQLKNAEEQMEEETKRVSVGERIVQEAADDVALLKEPDIQSIMNQMAGIELTNAGVALLKRRAELDERATVLKRESAALSESITSIEAAKTDLVRLARLPVKGLGLDETGVTLNGVPFEQASQAEQLRTSMAVAMAANPKLRILLIRDGSLLDSESLELVRSMAAEGGYQVWLESVTDGEGIGLVIEDGQVMERVT